MVPVLTDEALRRRQIGPDGVGQEERAGPLVLSPTGSHDSPVATVIGRDRRPGLERAGRDVDARVGGDDNGGTQEGTSWSCGLADQAWPCGCEQFAAMGEVI